MSDFTDLSNYPMPKNTSLIRSIIAEGDAYVLRMKEIPDLAEIWPGSSVFVIPGAGHVSAYFGHHSMFRQAILDSITSISKPITDLMIADTKAGFKMNLDIRTAAR
jgi:hypothetical protein